jgi:hypothetical protein
MLAEKLEDSGCARSAAAIKIIDELLESSKSFIETPLKECQLVSKTGGDYQFDGVVVTVFQKLSCQFRYVVEDDRGCLHIFSEKQLTERKV